MSIAMRYLLTEALRSAVEAALDPSMAAADWLARDIDPDCGSAVQLLTSPVVPLPALRKAKDAFKTMRILGETVADRRLAARLYAAAIASALVHHDQRISRQSTTALQRALRSLNEDTQAPDPIRHLAGTALCVLDGGSPT
jgi:hypothetical protein